jgi:hypothetical protein
LRSLVHLMEPATHRATPDSFPSLLQPSILICPLQHPCERTVRLRRPRRQVCVRVASSGVHVDCTRCQFCHTQSPQREEEMRGLQGQGRIQIRSVGGAHAATDRGREGPPQPPHGADPCRHRHRRPRRRLPLGAAGGEARQTQADGISSGGIPDSICRLLSF